MNSIVVTGVDGTGKTTLAKRLATHLSDSGITSSYMYGRLKPVSSRAVMWIGRNTLLRRSFRSNDYSLYRKKTREALHNPLLIYPYLVLIWLEYFLEIWLKLLPQLSSSRILILDRYVYDTVISDYAAHVELDDNQFMKVIDSWLRFFPKPDRTYLLFAPEEISFDRKKDIPHIEYLRERVHWYELLKERDNVLALDGTRSIDTNLEIIIKDLLDIGMISRGNA